MVLSKQFCVECVGGSIVLILVRGGLQMASVRGWSSDDFKVQDCSFLPLRGLLARRLINLGFQKVPGDIWADHR